MAEIVCYFFEGASVGVLMYFHLTNFRQGGLFASDQKEELDYITIMPSEYHRFNTEEVDAHSLTDLSSNAIEDSLQVDSDQASSDSAANTLLIPDRIVLNPSTDTS